MLQYYFLLELISHFSQKQNISKLCEGLYFLLAKGIQVIFFLLFGFHLLETMIAPSFDGAKNSILNKMIGLIPGAGSIVQSVAGTAIGSSLVIKNAVGAAGILFLLIFLLLPLVKLFIYIFLYFLLSVVLEPIADERFILCINAGSEVRNINDKSLMHVFCVVYCCNCTYFPDNELYRIMPKRVRK